MSLIQGSQAPGEVAAALRGLGADGGRQLADDELAGLAGCLPTDDERRLLAPHANAAQSLGAAEQLMLALMAVPGATHVWGYALCLVRLLKAGTWRLLAPQAAAACPRSWPCLVRFNCWANVLCLVCLLKASTRPLPPKHEVTELRIPFTAHRASMPAAVQRCSVRQLGILLVLHLAEQPGSKLVPSNPVPHLMPGKATSASKLQPACTVTLLACRVQRSGAGGHTRFGWHFPERQDALR